MDLTKEVPGSLFAPVSQRNTSLPQASQHLVPGHTHCLQGVRTLRCQLPTLHPVPGHLQPPRSPDPEMLGRSRYTEKNNIPQSRYIERTKLNYTI